MASIDIQTGNIVFDIHSSQYGIADVECGTITLIDLSTMTPDTIVILYTENLTLICSSLEEFRKIRKTQFEIEG